MFQVNFETSCRVFSSRSAMRSLAAVVLGMTIIFAFSLVAPVPTTAQTTITVGIPWGHPQAVFGGVFAALAEAYVRENPDVEIMFVPLWDRSKSMEAIATGVLPDIVFDWGNSPEMREVFIPLDDLMAKYDVKRDDYLPGALGQMVMLDQTWTLQVFVDPNFPLIYNRTMFSDVGLDPDMPPATVSDFDEMFPKLTVEGSDGYLTQIAMAPWMWIFPSPLVNALSFGSIFGASIWEGTDTDGQFGLTSPEMIEMYEWIHGYYDTYGHAAASLVFDLFDDSDARVITGRQAMGMWMPDMHVFRAQTGGLDLGIAAPFQKENTLSSNAIWLSGWPAGVTSQSLHPEEAFRFLKFMSHSVEGQDILARVGRLFPATRQSAGFDVLIEADPIWADFVTAVSKSTLDPAHDRLPVPLYAAFASVGQRVFRDGEAPADVLQEVQDWLQSVAASEGITITP